MHQQHSLVAGSCSWTTSRFGTILSRNPTPNYYPINKLSNLQYLRILLLLRQQVRLSSLLFKRISVSHRWLHVSNASRRYYRDLFVVATQITWVIRGSSLMIFCGSRLVGFEVYPVRKTEYMISSFLFDIIASFLKLYRMCVFFSQSS